MKVMLDFMRHGFRMRQPWPVWLGLLTLANGVGPLFFLGMPEGWVTLLVFGASALLMMGLFAAFGWVRLLGLGHSLWLGLVPWLWFRLDGLEPGSAPYLWVMSVILLNACSLALDIADTALWISGQREPTVTLD